MMISEQHGLGLVWCRAPSGGGSAALTLGLQVQVVVGFGLGAEHQLPQYDSEAKDVSLRRSGGRLQVLAEQLRGRPVELWTDRRGQTPRRLELP